MTEREKPREPVGEKTIRVTADQHARFQAFQYDGHFRNASIAMESLLAPDMLRISVPAPVMERWKAEAEESGFSLEAWAVQRIESGAIRCVFHAAEVREALAEIEKIKTRISTRRAPDAEEGPAEAPPFKPCKGCTTPRSCQVGGQDPAECE